MASGPTTARSSIVAATSDAMTYRVRVTSQHLARVLPHLAHYVKSLKVRDSDVEEFERNYLSFVRRQQQEPEIVRRARVPPRRSSVRTCLVIRARSRTDGKLNPAAANRWLASYVTPARATLAVAGDINPEEALRAADEAFGDWTGPVGEPDPDPLGQVGGPASVITHRPGATQAGRSPGMPTSAARRRSAHRSEDRRDRLFATNRVAPPGSRDQHLRALRVDWKRSGEGRR